ncbi:Axin-1, partial [Orchesella cincta]
MMMDEAQPPSSSSDPNLPPPEPDPPPNIAKMSQVSQPTRSRAQSSGTSEDNQSSSSPNSSMSPPWLRWSRGLSSLLDDQQGRDLYERYLDQEGCSAQLNFLWACEGLKCTASEDPPKIPQLVRSIHRHFFQNTVLLGISDKTRSDLAQAIIEGKFSEVSLFDKAEEEVQTHMQDNLYPNFLKSEIYLCAVNGEDDTSNLQEQLEFPTEVSGRKSSSGDATSGEWGGTGDEKGSLSVDVDHKSGEGQSPKIPSPPLSTAASVQLLLPNQLQTVHEDKELSVNPQSAASQHAAKLKLTKEALQMTQMSRASVPVAPVAASKIRNSREGFTSHFHPKPGNSSTTVPLHPYHASYSSYNPVSRVDSEIQSMSSDAMTDDGAHSGHGHSNVRKHGAHHHGSGGRKGQMPSHPHLHQPAHSSVSDRRQVIHPGVVIDNRDNLPKYPSGVVKGARAPNRQAELDSNTFASLLIKKLEEVKRKREIDEKLTQRISEFDDHVPHSMGASGGGVEEITPNVLAAAINRLQVHDEGLPDDILDQHMSRVFSDITPDNRSPKLRSPTSGRRRGGPSLAMVRARRERDATSTFSGDSGNVHDYSSDTLPTSMTKSRSIPAELKIQDHGDLTSASLIGASLRGRLSRVGGIGHGDSRNVPLSLMTKKTSSEFLDSGISVLSGATPTVISVTQPPPPLPCERTDLRVAQWMEQCGDDHSRPRSTTSPPMMRRPKKQAPMPHTSAPPTQTLEEVRRRLAKKTSPAVVLASQANQIPVGPSSSTSSIPPRHHSPPSSDESSTKEHSISSFVFYEDTEVPYCVKIPCKVAKASSGPASACGITLAVFKEHLPKRGNYRFFFKRECAEVYAKVVQEEITDDFQELPLFEGKIIAHLQAAVGTSSGLVSMSISDK